MQDIEFNFGDMVMKMVLKWRILLVSMLVVGSVLGVVGFIKSSGNDAQIQGAESVITLESLKAPLAEPTQKKVELSADNYLLFEELLRTKEEHMEHSIRMQIDYKNVSEMSVTYRVDAEIQNANSNTIVKDGINDLIELYLRKVLNSNTYEKISTEMGWNIDVGCISELVETEKSDNELFTIRIMTRNQEECTKIISIIKDRIEEVSNDVSQNFGAHKITLVDEIYSENINTELLKEKQVSNNEIIAISSEMQLIDDAFSAEELTYYNALISGSFENSGEQESIEEKDTNLNTKRIDIKYVLIGIIMGAGLALAYVLVQYVFSVGLRNSEEMTQLTGANVFGTICKASEKRKIMPFVDRYIYKLFGVSKSNEDEQAKLICSNIRVAMKKRNLQNVWLVTSCKEDYVEKIIEKLKVNIQNDSNLVQVGVDVLKDAEMLERMLMADGVILVEKENVSKYVDIRDMVELCEAHQLNILGNVFVKEI